MQMENNKLFDAKALEKINSQEDLHDYMRVTSHKLWMLLGAVILLLVGFIVFAATTTMENTMNITVEVQNFDTLKENQTEGTPAPAPGQYSLISSSLPASLADTLKVGMVVRLGTYKGKIVWISMGELDNAEAELYAIIEMNQGYVPFPDGTYDAELVLESTTPISFLWN